MPVTIRTGLVLKKLLDGKLEVQVEGRTIQEIFEHLGILEKICDSDKKLRRQFNVHINEGEDIRFLQGLDTPINDGDVVTVLSAIAGGADVTRKVWLTFPRKLVHKPLIWEIGQKFKVVTNIRQANISKDIGLVGLEMEGEESEIQKATDYLIQNGVSVEPVELDVME